MTDQELYDLATREDVYNEGVKASLALLFLAYSKELRALIRSELLGLGVDNMGELTKGQLNTLIYRLRASQNAIYGRYSRKLVKELERYAGAAGGVTSEVFEVSASPDAAKLWANVRNTPMPANGIYLDPFLKSFETSSIAEVENALRKAWVNGDTLQEALAHIAGKSTKQGVSSVVQLIERRAAAVGETAGAHVFTQATATTLATVFGQYRWVSVMDSRTSEICIERNGKIYTFGLGPVPPAHIRCRSHIAPTMGGKIKPENLTQWLDRQPANLQAELRAYANRKPLSISEFEKKANKIKGERRSTTTKKKSYSSNLKS